MNWFSQDLRNERKNDISRPAYPRDPRKLLRYGEDGDYLHIYLP